MVYPTRIDGAFAGTVWLLGDQFMPGAVATIQLNPTMAIASLRYRPGL